MTVDELAVLFDLAAPNGAQRAKQSILTVLEREQLINATVAAWEVTDRGRVFLDHVASLPLPVSSWSMPDAPPLKYREPPPISPNWPLHLTIDDDDGPPPPPPPVKRKRIIADPEIRKLEALNMMNAGFGLNEIKEELDLAPDEAREIFGVEV